MLEPGQTVDDFTLSDHTGAPVRWSEVPKPAVIFFYPKANTPGCTTESIAFRDLYEDFRALGVAVFGASADTVKRQSNFVAKHQLATPLLADPEHLILQPWGIWAEKKNYGRTYMGIKRTTVLFGADGRVAQVWENVRVKGHADKVLQAARELVGAASPGR